MRFDAQGNARQRKAKFLAADNLMAELAALDPAGLDAWLDVNVKNVPDMRALLKLLVIAVLVLQGERA